MYTSFPVLKILTLPFLLGACWIMPTLCSRTTEASISHLSLEKTFGLVCSEQEKQEKILTYPFELNQRKALIAYILRTSPSSNEKDLPLIFLEKALLSSSWQDALDIQSMLYNNNVLMLDQVSRLMQLYRNDPKQSQYLFDRLIKDVPSFFWQQLFQNILSIALSFPPGYFNLFLLAEKLIERKVSHFFHLIPLLYEKNENNAFILTQERLQLLIVLFEKKKSIPCLIHTIVKDICGFSFSMQSELLMALCFGAMSQGDLTPCILLNHLVQEKSIQEKWLTGALLFYAPDPNSFSSVSPHIDLDKLFVLTPLFYLSSSMYEQSSIEALREWVLDQMCKEPKESQEKLLKGWIQLSYKCGVIGLLALEAWMSKMRPFPASNLYTLLQLPFSLSTYSLTRQGILLLFNIQKQKRQLPLLFAAVKKKFQSVPSKLWSSLLLQLTDTVKSTLDFIPLLWFEALVQEPEVCNFLFSFEPFFLSQSDVDHEKLLMVASFLHWEKKVPELSFKHLIQASLACILKASVQYQKEVSNLYFNLSLRQPDLIFPLLEACLSLAKKNKQPFSLHLVSWLDADPFTKKNHISTTFLSSFLALQSKKKEYPILCSTLVQICLESYDDPTPFEPSTLDFWEDLASLVKEKGKDEMHRVFFFLNYLAQAQERRSLKKPFFSIETLFMKDQATFSTAKLHLFGLLREALMYEVLVLRNEVQQLIHCLFGVSVENEIKASWLCLFYQAPVTYPYRSYMKAFLSSSSSSAFLGKCQERSAMISFRQKASYWKLLQCLSQEKDWEKEYKALRKTLMFEYLKKAFWVLLLIFTSLLSWSFARQNGKNK